MWALMVFVQCVNNDAGFRRATCSLTFETTLFPSRMFCYLAFQFHIDELLFILLFLLCIMLSFICITSSPSIFMLSFFLSAFSCPPPPVQTDKKISIEHASHRKFTFPWLRSATASRCFVFALPARARVWVLTSVLARGAKGVCVESVYPHFVIPWVRWRRASPSSAACGWVLLVPSCLTCRLSETWGCLRAGTPFARSISYATPGCKCGSKNNIRLQQRD